MPDMDHHMMLDFHFFGVPFGSTQYIHNILDHGDIDYVKLFGVKHRHFMHDERAIQWVERNYGPFAGLVAKLHVSVDLMWSHAKRSETMRFK